MGRRSVGYLTAPMAIPQVVFATPGMLHAGQSLQIFRKWAGNEKNMVRGLGPLVAP